jgi:hypothetical protein
VDGKDIIGGYFQAAFLATMIRRGESPAWYLLKE